MTNNLGLDYNGIAALTRREIGYLKTFPCYVDGVEIENRRRTHRDCLWLSRHLSRNPGMSALARFIERSK